MSQFKPDIDDYKVIINPSEKDFTDSSTDIVLPVERMSNYVLQSNRVIVQPQEQVWKNLYNLNM